MSDVIRRNTPTTYQAMRITLQLPQNDEGEIVPLVDFAIRNADGVIIDEDHPTFTLTANEQSAVKTWFADKLAAYEAETGLERYAADGQPPEFEFYPAGAQYINAAAAAANTLNTARGTDIPNASFRYPLADPTSTIESYNAWCADLAAKGTGMIRLAWGGWSSPAAASVYGLEPPPYGTYNVWHTALDDSDLSTYRSRQVSGAPGDETFPIEYWDASNIKELLEACDTHGIAVILELSHNKEWYGYWKYHAWNKNNFYLNGSPCQEEDRGFLTAPTEVFTNPLALQALQDRISFVIRLVGGYKCVSMWGICEEGNWAAKPAFWGEESFNSTMIDNVRKYMAPWYQAIAEHIKKEDPHDRPVMSSVAQSPAKLDYVWPTNPDHPANVRMEPLVVDPVDIIGTNCYQPSFRDKVKHLNAIRAKVHPKRVLVHQCYPEGWSLGANAPIRIEREPYTDSKRCEWLGMVLEGSTGPGRWPGLVEEKHNQWAEGGYADPRFYSIGAVTEQFRSVLDWPDWSDPRDWEANTASVGLDYSETTGDGNHFVGLLVWTSPGQKTLTVTGIADGDWTFQVFDWTSGAISATAMSVAAGGSVSVDVVPSTYNQTVVYGEKKD